MLITDLPAGCFSMDYVHQRYRFNEGIEISEEIDPVISGMVLQGATSLIIVKFVEKGEILLYGLYQGCIFAYTRAVAINPPPPAPQ